MLCRRPARWSTRPALALLIALVSLLSLWARPAAVAHAGGGDKGGPVAALHTDFTLTATLREGGQTETIVLLRGTADINLSLPDLSARMRLDGPDGEAIEIVLVDWTLYTRETPGSGRWEREQLLTPDEVGELTAALAEAQANPEQINVNAVAETLAALGLQPTRLPDETVGGIVMHHDRLTLDNAAIERLFGVLATAVSELAGDPTAPPTLAELGLPGLRFAADLWTGVSDGFPYRLRLEAGASEAGDEITIVFDMRNTPLPVRVPITAPV